MDLVKAGDIVSDEKVSVGVKETTEVVKAVDAFIILSALKFKDGVQVTDFVEILQALVKDPVYAEAAKGAKEVIPELKDIDIQEGIGLAMVLLWGIPKWIEAFKKQNNLV